MQRAPRFTNLCSLALVGLSPVPYTPIQFLMFIPSLNIYVYAYVFQEKVFGNTYSGKIFERIAIKPNTIIDMMTSVKYR